MATSLHVLRTLALALWVGSIAFFAFGVAPVAFHVLPTTHEAGLVVSGSLQVLHLLAITCGIVFLVTTILSIASSRSSKLLRASVALVLLMTALTAYSTWGILPSMEKDRIAAGGAIDLVPGSAPARTDFDRLHHLSEQVEGSILLFALLALVLITIEPASPQRNTRRASL